MRYFWERITQGNNRTLGVRVFLITLFIHIFCVFFLHSGLTSISETVSDQVSYDTWGREIQTELLQGTYELGDVYEHHWYPLFVGVLYAVTTPSLLVGSLCNALLIALSALLLFCITVIVSKRPKESFWITLFVMNAYMSLVFNSSFLLKESFIVLLIVLSIYAALRFLEKEKFSWKWFVVFLVSFILLRDLRFFMGLSVLVGFFVGWFITVRIPLTRRVLYGGGMLIGVSMLSLLLSGGGIIKSMGMLEYIKPSFVHDTRSTYFKGGETTLNIKVVNQTAPKTEEADASYEFSVGGILSSAATALVGPFPWQLPLKKYLLAAIDLVAWYPIVLCALVTPWYERKRRNVWVILSCAMVLAIGIVAGTDNIGSLLRYRVPLAVVLGMLVPLGIIHLIPTKTQQPQL